jgi:ribosomal protein S18 acetylase RimI-like enzyme
MSAILQIRNVKLPEMNLLIDWAAAEGWNPGLSDAECFFAADPQGFFVAELAGEPVGCISAVAYGKEFGFIGFYIVRSEYRGRGYGMQLWQAAMEYLRGRNIGLDGVVAQQANYQKSGFQLAYRNIRYVAKRLNKPLATAGALPLSEVPFEQLAAYDRTMFAFDRTAFLQQWISRPGTCARGILRQGRLAGYGVLRACREGYKIGPLFADGPTEAAALFAALVMEQREGPVFLDVPAINPNALALVSNQGMAPVFETARMYTGAPPPIPLVKLYGVTSFELG